MLIRKFILIMFLPFAISSFFLTLIDKRLSDVLNGYIDSEVEKVSYYTVGKIVQKIKYDNPSDYLVISRDSSGNIEKISYDTIKINNLKNEILALTQQECINVENGDIDNNYFVQQLSGRKRYQYVKKGYLCEVNFSSIRNSVLFGNLGPSIPIKLSFLGYNNVDVDVDIKEYGINNVMVQINVEISLNCLITMPISSKIHNTVVKEPISVELIKGNVPSYYYSN